MNARVGTPAQAGDRAGWGARDAVAGAFAAGVLIAAIWAGSLGFRYFARHWSGTPSASRR